MAKSKVAVVQARPESILEDIARVCALAGLPGALDAGAEALLVPTLGRATPFPAANTTPWQLEGAILALRGAGISRVAWLTPEASPSLPHRDREPHPYEAILRRHAVPAPHVTPAASGRGGLLSAVLRDAERALYRPKAKLHILHRLFPDGITLPRACFGKSFVHLPTLRCDADATTAGAVASALSVLSLAHRRYAPRWVHRALVDWLAIQREIGSGTFVLADGTTAGNGPGPAFLIPVVKGYLLASTDPVAADAVAARLMGFDPSRIQYLRLASDDGLGVAAPEDIDLVGDDISGQKWGFDAGARATSRLGAVLDSAPLDPVRKVVLRSRLAGLLAAGSGAYQDKHRWQRQDRAVFERWKTETTWGQLFARYEQHPITTGERPRAASEHPPATGKAERAAE